MKMVTIPCGGRPVKVMSDAEIDVLRHQRKTMTISEMAAYHKVSLSTMNRRLKKAGCVSVRP